MREDACPSYPPGQAMTLPAPGEIRGVHAYTVGNGGTRQPLRTQGRHP